VESLTLNASTPKNSSSSPLLLLPFLPFPGQIVMVRDRARYETASPFPFSLLELFFFFFFLPFFFARGGGSGSVSRQRRALLFSLPARALFPLLQIYKSHSRTARRHVFDPDESTSGLLSSPQLPLFFFSTDSSRWKGRAVLTRPPPPPPFLLVSTLFFFPFYRLEKKLVLLVRIKGYSRFSFLPPPFTPSFFLLSPGKQ